MILDRFRLDGRVALVTGAASGAGPVLARALAEAGADLVLADRRADRLGPARDAVATAGRRAVAVGRDVAQPDDFAAAIDEAIGAFGRVDVLVTNAAIDDPGRPIDDAAERFDDVIEANLSSCYWAAQAVARVMEPGGVIVNVLSARTPGVAPPPGAAGLEAARAGVGALTRDLAEQWGGRRGIRVTAIAPGFIRQGDGHATSDGRSESLADRVLVGRAGEPDELGAALVFLASGAGSFLTGVTLPVDGGIRTD